MGVSSASLTVQPPVDLLEVQCEGSLGRTQAGMTIKIEGNRITGGHYFVADELRDISLSGEIMGVRIILSGADGSTFDLHLRSNGSERGEKLNFDNSVGLIGTRQKSGKIEKVNLGSLTMGQPSEGRRYSASSDLSDERFESIVRLWRLAVLSGNRKEAAKHTHFPLRVNVRRKHLTIRTPAVLFKQWDSIFTPAYLSRIKKDLPHDMLGDSSLMVMLGSGDVWFDDKGIEVLNLPD